jgi:Family of unknown function (DUF6271)
MWNGDRLLYIPTDRSAAEAITCGVAESAQIRSQTGRDILFLLVEQPSRASYTDLHRNALANAAQAEQVSFLQLTSRAWTVFAQRLVASAKGDAQVVEALAMLDTTKRAYGVAPSKAYLVAAALGVRIIHRRDSDHLPDHDQDGQVRFPGVLEAAAVGRSLQDIGLSEDGVEQEVLFAGSSMLGEPPVDRRSLIAAGVEHLYAIEQLAHPDRPRQQVEDRVNHYYFDEPRERIDGDAYRLDTTGSTEIGISCLKDIFRELPELPMSQTLGTDYMVKNLLYQLGRPVVFHTRKMLHRYDGQRTAKGQATAVAYALSDLRFLLLRRLLAMHNRNIRSRPDIFTSAGGSLIADQYAANLERVIRESGTYFRPLVDQFSAVYREATGGPRDAADVNRAIALATKEQGDALVVQMQAGLGEYARLVRAWPSAVASAEAVGPEALANLIVSPQDS